METRRFSNEQIARLLREIAAVYEIKGESLFRIRAYQNAAASVEHATEDLHSLWEEGRLKELAGIGEALAGHLDELFRKGKSKHFEAVKKNLPPAMFKILGIPGVGPKTAFKLAKTLKLPEENAREELRQAALRGKIARIEGFGEVSEKEILASLSQTKKSENRMILPVANEIADRLLDYLKNNPAVIRADPLGSLRRQVDTVGDIDIAVSTTDAPAVVDYFCRFPEADTVLNQGEVKGRILLKKGRQVDLMTQSPKAYGALLQHFTGSKNHNIHLRELAKLQGLSLSEKGIKNKSGKIEIFKTEEDFYERLGLAYIPPEVREDRGEIEAALRPAQAKAQGLPELVEVKDIRGDLQCHTIWSDGANTIAEMVEAGDKRGYEYLGVTDHQQSLESLGENDILKEVRRRKLIIEHLNGSSKNLRVLNGIELLIKASGELAYPDRILREFDYVIAAIHTGFNLGREANTRRIVNALENPSVKILAHPTGRILGSRDGMEIDWPKVFATCARFRKILEIDAMPERLDLPDLLVREAKKFGLKFAIDADAHALEHLGFIKYGVSVARRGWLTRPEVINTFPFAKLKEVLGINRR